MIRTEAWVLYPTSVCRSQREPGLAELRSEIISLPDITEREVLVEPLYGCWEGNMSHALRGVPVDICRQRGEEKTVIGNAGVVRVLKTGSAVKTVVEGDLCVVFCNGVWDAFGYPDKIFGYDSPGTTGLLARRTKLHEKQLIRIPRKSRYSLQQWAAFSLRYITAWANWKVAYGCWRLLLAGDERPATFVWGWGGGVTLGELALAQLSGCRVAMISSRQARLEEIQGLGITPIDRRQFENLNFNYEEYLSDPEYKKSYLDSEEIFLDIVKERTSGLGVSIFIDFIGLPVFRATLKALGKPGVITTAGWKAGMNLSTVRALECMNWHTHVHTHYARYAEGVEAVCFAEDNGWMPPVEKKVYDWAEIPQLARDHAEEKVISYFPIFQINPP